MLIDNQLVDLVAAACRQAGASIMAVYNAQTPPKIDRKPDASPVTEADLQADAILRTELVNIIPDAPILSEESVIPGYETRKNWSIYWLVDPLDGTKEFINQNGEFTVNVALIERGQPVLGVVYAPALGRLYWGAKALGAGVQENGVEKPLKRPPTLSDWTDFSSLRVVQSRRSVAAVEHALEQKLNSNSRCEMVIDRMGSSLKYCLVAQGDYDLSVMTGPTSEWDTAAAQAVLTFAGGYFCFTGCNSYSYNKPSLLNPTFFVSAHPMGDLGLWLGELLQRNRNNKV